MWTALVLAFQLRRRLILGVKREEGQTEEVGRFIVADDYSPLIYSHPAIERDGRLQCSCFPLRAPLWSWTDRRAAKRDGRDRALGEPLLQQAGLVSSTQSGIHAHPWPTAREHPTRYAPRLDVAG